MQRPRPDTGPSPGTWILSDGRAGNLRQAAALADALGIDSARHWALDGRAPWRWAAPRQLPFGRFAFGAAFARALETPPSLAIGCGRQAALATRLVRSKGARTVQILDPRIDLRHWDVVIAPEHDGLRGDNVLAMLGSLHPVDDAWLARARTDFDALAQLPRPRIALLVGGPTRDSGMDDAAFSRTLARVEAACLAEGGSLLATASRRTPEAWRRQLQHERPRPPGITWLGEGRGAGPPDANPYPGLLAWADRIVCTPDSVNMVSEACATRVPVFVADPDRASGRPRKFLDALRARDRIRAVDDALAPYPVEPLRETTRIAGLLRARLAA